MRLRPITAAAALAAAALAAPHVLPPPAGAAARTATLPGWTGMTATISGRALLVTTAAPVRAVPGAGGERAPTGARAFVYYRAEAARLRLNAARTLVAPLPEPLVSLRTSIGVMGAGRLTPAGDGRFVMVPTARAFAPPVVLCCDPEDVETVLVSDGRADAPAPLAAAVDGPLVRMLLLRPDGTLALAEADPAGPPLARAESPLPGTSAPGLAAIGPGLVAWAAPGVAALGLATTGPGGAAGARTLPLPGPALEVLVDGGRVVVAMRRGAGASVVGIDAASGRGQVLWSGVRRPRLAVGGGAVALADGRRVLAGRSGRLRPVRRAPGAVAALAVDGDRLATFSRVRRGGERRTVVRIEALR